MKAKTSEKRCQKESVQGKNEHTASILKVSRKQHRRIPDRKSIQFDVVTNTKRTKNVYLSIFLCDTIHIDVNV